MRRLAILGAALAVASCAPPPLAFPRAAPAPVAAAQAPAASPIPKPKDACGAAELQGLVGHARTEIPVPVHPERQRVACTTCPVTQDFRPERLNFFFDADSGLIRAIKCG
jgi:hypothetical protein